MSALRLGTRGSALALAQARPIAEKLGAELVIIESEGDRSTAPLTELGGAGVFAAALRVALSAGEVDVVVHSYKDLPTAPMAGLVVAAVPKRGDTRDAVCASDGRTLADLPSAARVGTGSPRRRAQILAHRPDLDVVDLRGNVDTRLGAVASGELDAVVLAAAGLTRLGRLDSATELLEIGSWPTAPAQGALAIEVRRGDERTVSQLEHRPSRLAAEAERAVLARLEAGCSAPIGAHAMLDDGLLFLTARLYALDGATQLTSSHALYPEDSADAAADLAERVSVELLSAGAANLVPSGSLGGGRE